MQYYEYVEILQKKYRVTNTELLEELAASGNRISKSNLSHKLKGERRLTPEELEIVIQTLSATAAESEKLRRLYRISQFGENRWHEAELVRQSLSMLSGPSVRYVPEPSAAAEQSGDLRGIRQLGCAVYAMLHAAWGRETVSIQCPVQCRLLADILCTIAADAGASPVQLMTRINNLPGDPTDDENIRCLFSADRIAGANSGCEIRYYYDSAESGTVFPFYIVTESRLLLLSQDCENGYLLDDRKLAARYRAEFGRLYAACRPMLCRTEADGAHLRLLTELEESCRGKFYVMQHDSSAPYGAEYAALCGMPPQPLAELFRRRLKAAERVQCVLLYAEDTRQTCRDDSAAQEAAAVLNGLLTEQEYVAACRMMHHRQAQQRRILADLPELDAGTAVCCFDSGRVLLVHQGSSPYYLLSAERRIFCAFRSFFDYLILYGSEQT